jgi:FAD/FMN-containing dehydrogenase
MNLADSLRQAIEGDVDAREDTLEKYSRDASLFRVRPEVVVYPRHAQDICTLVSFVKDRRKAGENVSLTPRSAGTDMSGGPLSDSIVLDMTKYFSHIHTIGDAAAVVEPGVFFRDFDRETKKRNLELPSYTASREINTLGGMVANNSGGEKNLKYGKTAKYVEELDVVLSDGNVHALRLYEGGELMLKKKGQSFEGEVYRKMGDLLSNEENRKVISAAKPHVEKNSSGYALWDMGDGVQSLNLARLMVGAQGTLGIITNIQVGLVHPKPYAAMSVIFLKDLSELGDVIPEVLEHKPDSFESYDDHTFSLGVKYFPEFATQLKSNLFALGVAFLPEMWMAATGGIPKLVLMVEFREDSQGAALSRAETCMEDLLKRRSHLSVRVVPNEEGAKKYWAIRRESFNLLHKKVRGKRTAPFIDDFVVPPRTLPQFLPKLNAILDTYDLTYTVAGHVGDGNFHIIPLVDSTRPDLAHLVDELSHKVYDLVLSYEGSISGEHNDGLVRTPYVEKMFGHEMYELFRKTKDIFDPLNIFNPGKKVNPLGNELDKLDVVKK